MAFMMPVMKKEFDIYRTGRSRRTSECSSNSSTCRSRKISECRSECPSLSTSPANEYISPSHRTQSVQIQRNVSRPVFSRSSSRTSQASLITSPTKTVGTGCSPPKPISTGSQSSLNKFHSRLVEKLRKSFRKGRSEDRS